MIRKVKIRFHPQDKTKGLAYLYKTQRHEEFASKKLHLIDPNSAGTLTITEEMAEALRKEKIRFIYID